MDIKEQSHYIHRPWYEVAGRAFQPVSTLWGSTLRQVICKFSSMFTHKTCIYTEQTDPMEGGLGCSSVVVPDLYCAIR